MKKKIIAILAILAALLLVLTAVRLITREQIPEGALAVHMGEKTSYITLDQLNSQQITGTLINGKGQEKQVDASGVPLKSVLEAAKIPAEQIHTVTLTADDAYSAEIKAEELEENKVYLAREEDGSVTLVVFGDSNSKRQVHNVVSLDVQ